MEVDPVAPPRRRAPEPMQDEEEQEMPKPSSRRTRLAALAQNINTWEDDLTRHNIK